MDNSHKHHTITGKQFKALVAGFGDENDIAVLRRGTVSRWTMTISAISELLPAETAQAIDVLERARSASTQAFDLVALYPTNQAWATSCLASLVEHVGAESRLLANHLNNVAASAALLAGVPFEITVLARQGLICLPSLGEVNLGSAIANEAKLQSHDGHELQVVLQDRAQVIDRTRETVIWRPLRQFETSWGGLKLHLSIDDLGPFRGECTAQIPPASRLDDEALQRWTSLLEDAWTILVEDHLDHAHGISAGLQCVIPVENVLRIGHASPDAFGALVLTAPENAHWMAFQLLVGFQKGKLQALHHLLPMHHATHDEHRYMAPNLPQPQNFRVFFDSAFAHSAAAAFWGSVQSRSVVPEQSADAEMQFARWSDRAASLFRYLQSTGELTDWGIRALDASQAAMQKILASTRPSVLARTVARHAELDHRISWRIRNLRPAADVIAHLADEWTAAHVCPNIENLPLFITQRTELNGFLLRNQLRVAVLHKSRKSHEDNGRELRITGENVDVGLAHVALVESSFPAARQLWADQVQQNTYDPENWAGLSATFAIAAMTGDDMHPLASSSFAYGPEIVMSLHHHLLEAYAEHVDPLRLATWLFPVATTASQTDFRLRDYS